MYKLAFYKIFQLIHMSYGRYCYRNEIPLLYIRNSKNNKAINKKKLKYYRSK